ncbi:hypothetical protein Thexy_0970 [Thermoanaerobacterium xylanolyticum LX-11]|uniref:Primosome, DnaD subunit n=1 Tax=Thermoanaerobacterium xylanolyticum (strain ATCC 49914 / DSM 7097 / LX-11) TaxID=858215 RepID=F6BJU7_THEXL|nr:hypothetical protein [Thermoanaerobacterium xylanolyticum]AEF17004.1 hypothetical protein Thexy_0970 [Thermoanaerobacterium xylanolyticum LX-11]
MLGIGYIYENLDILSGSEIKLLLFLLKHADKAPAHITTDEFQNGKLDDTKKRLDSGTGLSAGAISETIKKLIDKKLLICFIDNTDLGRIKKYYMISKNESDKNVTYAYDKETCQYFTYEDWLKSINVNGFSESETTSQFSKPEGGSSFSETIKKSPVSKSDDIYTMSNNIYKSYQSDRWIDKNNMIDRSINHEDFPTVKKFETEKQSTSKNVKLKSNTPISNALINTIKSKYGLSDDDVKICLSRMKGKEIKYPAKFLEKVAENYVKEKELFSQIESAQQPKRDYEVPRNYFNSYPQRKYNIEELERYLLTGRASDDHVFPSYT